MPRILRHRGIRQIGQGLGTLDREVFEAIAESPSPLLDSTMPRLTRAADHSKLWFAIAAALAATRHRASRRGAARGVMTLGVTSLFTNQVAKQVWKRPRPNRLSGPLGEAEQAGPDIELAAFGPLRERGRLRRRRRPREPAARAWTRITGGTGGPIQSGDRRALSRAMYSPASASAPPSPCSARG